MSPAGHFFVLTLYYAVVIQTARRAAARQACLWLLRGASAVAAVPLVQPRPAGAIMRCSPLTWWAISCSRRAFLGSAGINIPSALRDVILHRSCDMSGPTFGPMHMRSVTPLGRAFRTRWFECCCALFARQDCARSGCKDAAANRQQDVRRSSQPAERLPRRCPTVLWPWSGSATLSARAVAARSQGRFRECWSSEMLFQLHLSTFRRRFRRFSRRLFDGAA